MLGCGCLFGLFAAVAPRLALALLWLTTNLVDRAFVHLAWPLLGLVFAPFTTLAYVFCWRPVTGVEGGSWAIVGLAVLVDVASWGGAEKSRRSR